MTGPRHLPAARCSSSPRQAGSLCTGYGGLDLAAAAVLGAVLAWFAETDRHASKVLAARFPGVPNLGDLTQVDWAAVPRVDLLTAGVPVPGHLYRRPRRRHRERNPQWPVDAHR